MLTQIVLTSWALVVTVAAAVGARAALVLRHDETPTMAGGATLDSGAGDVAVQRLLDEVRGVVDLIEAEAARLEVGEGGRTLDLARSLLASSMSRYREAVTPSTRARQGASER